MRGVRRHESDHQHAECVYRRQVALKEAFRHHAVCLGDFANDFVEKFPLVRDVVVQRGAIRSMCLGNRAEARPFET
jgi:hypothetical protein